MKVKSKGKDRTIVSSTVVKIIAFFLLAISLIVGMAGGVATAILWEWGVYTTDGKALLEDAMYTQAWEDVIEVSELYKERDMDGMEAYLSERNLFMEIYDSDVEKDTLLWSNYNGSQSQYTFNHFTEFSVIGKGVTEENDDVKSLLFRVYVNDEFPIQDDYKFIHVWGNAVLDWMYVIPVVTVISVFVFFTCFIFLMCSAGHHRGQEGITGGVLYFFHFDVLTCLFGLIACLGFAFAEELVNYGGELWCVLALLVFALTVTWCTIYCRALAIELKMGTLFKHTLIYQVLSKLGRGIRKLWRGLVYLVKGIPLVTGIVVAYIGFGVVQFITLLAFCGLWRMDQDVLLLCVLEKLILLPIVIYLALMCKKLQQGSKALAEGQLHYKVDTDKMLLGFREHGENLNRIGEGISLAVDERMKSEHLKTELITNVSHDLKTPLTSIINYADLISTISDRGISDDNDKEQLAQYSEVLLRQSKRLKKLLEDLVEASKATTGNLDVKLEKCEVSVILSQAIGEYVQRFSEKDLTLLVKQPEEPVCILADGRHLWRVFDNLLNNICKYAQEHTRVYLTVDSEENEVSIVFRNMSKYQLDVSAEELQERFVRGDKSRHMEGNGLGLSIAGSLVELQGGTMEIVTDGDLFKVILRFGREQ